VPSIPPSSRFVLTVALAVVGANPPLGAAAGGRDSAPVLLSRTGGSGGDTWADLKELQQAAAKGNPKAEAQLGELLLRGEGLPRDDTRAVTLLEKAARAGQGAAAFRLGMLLAHGENGVAKDPVRALAYFRAAAAGGEAEGFFNIGAAYASARGVKRSYAEALGWLIVARQHGADAGAEQSLRAQIQRVPSWIATGERRAKEIAAEFKDKKVVDYLPPVAPLDKVYDPLKPALTAPGSR
jgi:TPR repeat protein